MHIMSAYNLINRSTKGLASCRTGSEDADEDSAGQPNPRAGSKISVTWRDKIVVVISVCEIRPWAPSGNTRENNDIKRVASNWQSPFSSVRSITLDPLPSFSAGHIWLTRANRGSMPHLKTRESNVRREAKSRVPMDGAWSGSPCFLEGLPWGSESRAFWTLSTT